MSNTVSGSGSAMISGNTPIPQSVIGPMDHIRGFIPIGMLDVDNDDEYSQMRFTLREAWNTQYRHQLKNAKLKRITTPFRAVNNAGDLLDRNYYSCQGPTQTFQSRPNLRGLKSHFGAIHSKCDGTGVPAAACNVRYVYDGSDYTKYLKQKAVSQNYNDVSYGGNKYSGAQSAIRASLRY